MNVLSSKEAAVYAFRKYGYEWKWQTFGKKLVRQPIENITVYDDRFVVDSKSEEKAVTDK